MIITDDNFQEAIDKNSLILIDFWAEWCGPCRKVSPILDEISKETGLLIGRLNVDDNLTIPFEFDVQTIPTMVLFKDGNPVHTIMGAMPKHRLMKELAEWI